MAPWHPLRPSILPAALLLSCALSSVWAQADSTDFDCHAVLSDLKYDLTQLDKEFSLVRERDTPPTKWKDTVRFNLCSDLKQQDGVAAEDQVCCNNTHREMGLLNCKFGVVSTE